MGNWGEGDPMLLSLHGSRSFVFAKVKNATKTRSGLLAIFVIFYENVKSKFYTDYPSPNGKNTAVSQFKINITD